MNRFDAMLRLGWRSVRYVVTDDSTHRINKVTITNPCYMWLVQHFWGVRRSYITITAILSVIATLSFLAMGESQVALYTIVLSIVICAGSDTVCARYANDYGEMAFLYLLANRSLADNVLRLEGCNPQIHWRFIDLFVERVGRPRTMRHASVWNEFYGAWSTKDYARIQKCITEHSLELRYIEMLTPNNRDVTYV